MSPAQRRCRGRTGLGSEPHHAPAVGSLASDRRKLDEPCAPSVGSPRDRGGLRVGAGRQAPGGGLEGGLFFLKLRS